MTSKRRPICWVISRTNDGRRFSYRGSVFESEFWAVQAEKDANNESGHLGFHFEVVKMVPHCIMENAIRSAVVRVSQQSDELGTVSASEAERIIWEEIDKRLEAKP